MTVAPPRATALNDRGESSIRAISPNSPGASTVSTTRSQSRKLHGPGTHHEEAVANLALREDQLTGPERPGLSPMGQQAGVVGGTRHP